MRITIEGTMAQDEPVTFDDYGDPLHLNVDSCDHDSVFVHVSAPHGTAATLTVDMSAADAKELARELKRFARIARQS